MRETASCRKSDTLKNSGANDSVVEQVLVDLKIKWQLYPRKLRALLLKVSTPMYMVKVLLKIIMIYLT